MSASEPLPGSPPSPRSLENGLELIFADRCPLRVVGRNLSPRFSTYLAEVVHVEFADGSREELLCKYSNGVALPVPTPHRGLRHEAMVYAQVLHGAPMSLPQFWGSFADPETGDLALVMRYYRDGISAAQASDQGGVEAAIRWLADMHKWAESRIDDPAWADLARYDADYYGIWLDHTCTLARHHLGDCPWLDHVAAVYREHIPLLASASQTLIHGEFTTRNSLWAGGRVMPVDWETAAIGPAEIDLAVFTYDWDLEDLRGLDATYVQHRWKGDPPRGFRETMLAARLYVAFHWIFSGSPGDDPARIRSHVESLRAEAIRWGIVT